MKKNILLTFIALLSVASAQAYDFQSGDLYYNITSSAEPYAVEVTYQKAWSEDNYKRLTSVTIPATVIYNGATYNVTAIGSGAFGGCTGLTSVAIPHSVTSIEQSAFYGCTGLTSVTIPNSVTSIGGMAFFMCSGLTSIAIPDSVTSIGHMAFFACTSLTAITIPNSVTSIGMNAFTACTGLTVLKVDNDNAVYDSRYSCDAIIETSSNTLVAGCRTTIIPNSVTSIGDYAFCNCTGLKYITIPNSVTSIGRSAFGGCTGLTSITIPNSVTSIGEYAFHGCTGLTSMKVDTDNTVFDSRNTCNAIIETSSNTLVAGCKTTIIPNSVTNIGVSAFSDCTSLTSITIPNSVTSIGDGAFSRCTGLTSIRVEAQTPPQCSDQSFYDIPKDIPVYISCGTKEAYQAADGWSAFTNIIEEHDYAATILSSNEDYGTTTIVSYTCNNELTIQATANEHYHFTQWSDGSTDNPRTFVVVQDTALMAIFAPNQYSISVSSEYGSIQGAGKYDYGTTATLIAKADEHYHFTQWNDGNTDNPRKITIEGDATYTAEFAIDQFTITATCELQYGEVTGGGVYDYGTPITLTAIPHSGYEFKQWSNGLTDNPYHFTVLEDLTLEAVFIPSAATAIENTEIVTTPQKVLINGQIYILRNGRTYTLTGTKVA